MTPAQIAKKARMKEHRVWHGLTILENEGFVRRDQDEAALLSSCRWELTEDVPNARRLTNPRSLLG
jgi:predicted transcriptional regulator